MIDAPPALEVHSDSIAAFKERADGNTFSGVVDIRSGMIYLYPLLPSDISDDGYGNTEFTGNSTFLGEDIEPINHFEDHRAIGHDWVSHEILVLLVEQAKAKAEMQEPPSISGKDDLTPLLGNYVGFTLWANLPGASHSAPWFVWSSRSCNQQKFYTQAITKRGGGHTDII